MKVLLVVPPDINVIEPFRSSKKIKDCVKFIKGFPLGLGYIAAVLEKNNIEVEILDGLVKGLSLEKIADFIQDSPPRVLGITTLTPNIKTAVELAREVKLINRDIITVFGGPHAMHDHYNLLKNYDVDFVVFGEGEFIFLNLINALKGRYPLDDVRGIAYREDGKIRWNKGSVFVEDLDNLPYPARHLTDFDAYLKHFTHDLSYAAQILTSRGCPYRCAFCGSGSTFFKWRGRQAESIVNEIEQIINTYPRTKSISFMDDNFTLDRQRVIDICALIIKRGLNKYPWDCLSRCSALDEEMLQIMKEAGCVRIQYGIESGSAQILKNIGKQIDLEQASKTINLTKRCGIEAYAFFMLGNPGETEETIKKSIDFAFNSKPTYVNWFITQVYPGTKLAEAQNQDDWVKYIYEPEIREPSIYTHPCVPTFNPVGFDREILKAKISKIMRIFFWKYLPGNFKQWFKKLIRHPIYSLWYMKRILVE